MLPPMKPTPKSSSMRETAKPAPKPSSMRETVLLSLVLCPHEGRAG
jgi:hypothetical protein